jgi:hypothetical protein
MKLISYILSFTVIYLSVKPALDATPFLSTGMESCCSVSKCDPFAESAGDHHDEQEDNSICNPFEACGSCLLTLVKAPFEATAQLVISTETFFNYQSIVSSQFTADFWQPPQVV